MRSTIANVIVIFLVVICFYALPTVGDDFVVTRIESTQQKISAEINAFGRVNDFIYPKSTLRTNDGSVLWSLEHVALGGTVRKYEIENGKSTLIDIADFIPRDKYRKNTPFVFNRPKEVHFDVSPDGKFLMIRRFADTTILYDIENKKHVSFLSKKPKEKNETMLGFDSHGNIYCGVQSISPIVILRKFDTGEILREYKFSRLNYLPLREDYSYWIESDRQNELGLNFNYLSSPIESPDGKYTVFSFTTFQFRCLFAIVLICDNTTQRVIAKQLVDTSGWDLCTPKFVFSKDSKKLLYQDGRIFVNCFDLEKRLIEKRFEVPLRGDEPDYVAIAYEIESFFFTPSGDAIVQMRLPDAVITNSATQQTPTTPLKTTYFWNMQNNVISFPKPWTVDNAYTLMHWISPDETIVAIISIKYDQKFTVIDPVVSPAELQFVQIKNGKLLHSIKGDIRSVLFAKNWSTFEITYCKKTDFTYEVKEKYRLSYNTNDSDNTTQSPQPNTFYDYRQWVTINGKRRVRAKVISVDVDKNNKKIITSEDEQTKEKIQTFFDQLHDIDQKYMHEIDKKIKAEKSKEK
jgi:hypothetical protein